MEEDEKLLLEYSRCGDVKSLAALIRRHSTWMQALLRGMLPSVADADDAFQESWMKVIRSAKSYRGGKVKSYLAVVARSVAIDHMRREHGFVSLDAEEGEGHTVAVTASAAEPTPGEMLEHKMTSEDVRRAVRALPERMRQVLLMRIEGDLSFKEIADALGVPLGTALTWMHNATIKLRKMLGGGR